MEKEYKLDNAFYLKESSKWLKSLNELRVENIHLKDSLSQAISREVSHEFVEQAERFQQHFIEKDQVIDLLRHEINMLVHKLAGKGMTGEDECIILKKDTEQLIGEFHRMKTSFASFLSTGKTG